MFRVTFFFQMGDYGWSESFVNDQVSLSGALDEANELATARRQFLPPDVVISGGRISDPGIRGDSTPLDSIGPGVADWPDGPHYPYSSILVRLDTTDPSVRGRVFTRPAPEVVGKPIQSEKIVPDYWRAGAGAWRSLLMDATRHWAVEAVDPSFPTVPIKGNIAIIAGKLDVATFRPHGILEGQRFRISRSRGLTMAQRDCFNRVYTAVAPLTSTTLTANTSMTDRESEADVGFVRGQDTIALGIGITTVEGYVSHRVGRPSGGPRGRRSRRPVCQ